MAVGALIGGADAIVATAQLATKTQKNSEASGESRTEPTDTQSAERHSDRFILRIGKDGTGEFERWSVDNQGDPDRLVEQHAAKFDKPIVELRIERDGRTGNFILAEYRLKGGERNALAYPLASIAIGSQPGQPTETGERRRLDGRSSLAQEAAIPDAGELDLLRLAHSYSEAIGAVRAAEVKLVKLKNAMSKTISQDTTSAELALENATRTEKLLRRILEALVESGADTYERAQKSAGDNDSQEVIEARRKLLILKAILDTPPSTGANNATPNKSKP